MGLSGCQRMGTVGQSPMQVLLVGLRTLWLPMVNRNIFLNSGGRLMRCAGLLVLLVIVEEQRFFRHDEEKQSYDAE